MRIAFISTFKEIGGVSTATRELSREFRKRNHQVTIFPLVDMPSLLALGYYTAKVGKGFDVVHIQGIKSIPPVISGLLASRILAGCCVCTAHGFTPPYWYPSKTKRQLMKFTLGHYDALISVSNFVGRRLSNFLGKDAPRHFTVYNGVDANFFSPSIDQRALKQKMGLMNKKVILYVGRLAPKKGVHHLLGAFSILSERLPGLFLVVCGRGEMEGELRSLAQKLALNSKVTFAGVVPQNDLPLYYSIADVVAVPSVYEPMGIVPLEAMSVGRPVVASRTGGLPELIEDMKTGLLTPPGDVPALAEALRSLCEDDELAESLGNRGRQAVLEKFTWSRSASATLSAYEAALRHAS
ncbi:MAG: glycosyltransferase family 4 protein [Thaumarchaeota archaeon]|nr:glycosyltransferase family 4 protein [Nitrososphaerota archaeon]